MRMKKKTNKFSQKKNEYTPSLNVSSRADVEVFPEEQKQKHIMIQQQQYIGPIPPAEQLSKYQAIDPNLPNRIFEMAEKEQNKRLEHQAENIKINQYQAETARQAYTETIKINRRGQLFAFITAILLVLAAFYMIYLEYPTQAATVLCTGLAAMIAAFINERKKSSVNDENEK